MIACWESHTSLIYKLPNLATRESALAQ